MVLTEPCPPPPLVSPPRRYVTGGYVSQEEAGERLAATVADAATGKSGVYWSWNGGARTVGWLDVRKNVVRGAGGAGGELFENEPSDLVRDPVKAKKARFFGGGYGLGGSGHQRGC